MTHTSRSYGLRFLYGTARRQGRSPVKSARFAWHHRYGKGVV